MIAYLRGKLLAKKPNQVVIETCGIGFEVNIPLSTYCELGEVGSEVELYIHTQISVRQSVVALDGFKTSEEHLLFEKLISVTGIGPTMGLKILSGMPVQELVATIRRGDIAKLTRIPALGKKNAERMVVELRDKLAAFGAEAEEAVPVSSDPVRDDLISALLNLGYSRPVAEQAAEESLRDGSKGKNFEAVLKRALKQLVR